MRVIHYEHCLFSSNTQEQGHRYGSQHVPHLPVMEQEVRDTVVPPSPVS